MPIINVQMIEGRTTEQKEALIAAVAQAVMDSIGAPEENIRVIINEYAKGHWGMGKLPAHKAGR
ncbi:2-hydroxymuconate tautomerase [Alteromonas lipolytica]|uniref:Tautomerase n=1 Tax=Alteromonas lipolytica TaxID=1856405 RepID=A0A1E8FBZ0_9ALTE|nr:2-hydroxymuconate tautomerase [Alteromonas lipolytica]OFI33013.1 4-oxalocrotonate tautomerase [Alteromonas lipolytica]GGF63334.1 putative tautomerase [Alteromonas lipolytica]